MTIVPVLVFVAAVLLALAFEFGYAFLDARMSLSLDHEVWTLFFWLAVGILGFTSGVIPRMPPLSSDWLPLLLVAGIHLLVNVFGPSVLTFHRPFSQSNSQDNSQGPSQANGGTANNTTSRHPSKSDNEEGMD